VCSSTEIQTRRGVVIRLRCLRATLLALLVLLTTGCLRVVRQEAPYYADGPQQAAPPDGFFEPGTKVMVFGERDSYCPVMTFDMTSGWVWKQDLVSPSEWRKLESAGEQSERFEFGEDTD
jgi:hypothetical protein